MRLLPALLAALLLAAPAWASEQRPTQAELEAEIMCPACKTTLDQSDAPVADRMKALIARRIAAGDTKSEIKTEMVRQFGPAVLAAPPRRGFDLLAWALPLGAFALGAVLAAGIAWRWSRARGDDHDDDAALDPVFDRRLDAELAKFDG